MGFYCKNMRTGENCRECEHKITQATNIISNVTYYFTPIMAFFFIKLNLGFIGDCGSCIRRLECEKGRETGENNNNKKKKKNTFLD